jgi:predicted nucleic acid-binding protein
MFLLDTNVISEIRKARSGKADPNVVNWFRAVPATSLYLSAIVIHELQTGMLRLSRRDSRAGEILREWLHEQILPEFTGRILPIDTNVALQGAKLQVSNPRPIHDGLIAATALVHGMTMVTRNVADFATSGVAILNPWSEQIS